LLSVFDLGSPLAEFADKLQPKKGETVITKHYPSAFFETSLSASLVAAGIDTLLIAGVTTSGCVRGTAVDAMQYGFIPVVVRDAVGDRDSGPHEANLYDLQAKYANVVSQATALDYLRNSAAPDR
jgi:maleamate amidohydrolase